MAYGDFKDLNKRTVSDEMVPDRSFNIAKILKHDGYQRGFASMVYKSFDKKASGGTVKNEIISSTCYTN